MKRKTTNVVLIFLGLKAKEIGGGIANLFCQDVVLFTGIFAFMGFIAFGMASTHVWYCFVAIWLAASMAVLFAGGLLIALLWALGEWLYDNAVLTNKISKERKAEYANEDN